MARCPESLQNVGEYPHRPKPYIWRSAIAARQINAFATLDADLDPADFTNGQLLECGLIGLISCIKKTGKMGAIARRPMMSHISCALRPFTVGDVSTIKKRV